jgi:KDO2-lipid IV(A) lauroyltransferase
MIGNIALYLALRLVALVLPFFPLTFVYWLCDVAGTFAYLCFPIPRRLIERNLSVVMGLPRSDPAVKKAARRCFQTDAKNWIDTLRIGRQTQEELEEALQMEPGGWDRLTEAYDKGNGVVFVGLHLGNYDFVGQAVVMRGFRVTVPVERIKPPQLYDFLTRERRSKGINAVPIEEAPRAMVQALRKREMIAILGDRAVSGTMLPVELFGKTAYLAKAPVALARKTGAELIVGCAVRIPGNRYHGMISPPVPVRRSKNVHEDDQINVQRLAATIEPMIAAHPDQWLMFDDVWPTRDNAAVTMRNPNEAAV